MVRYSPSLTQKVVRKRLGVTSVPRRGRGFKLASRFRAIPPERRMQFLRRKAVPHWTLSFAEMRQMRRSFDARKTASLPLSTTTRCYVCSLQATLRHHVLPISAGGRNKRNNIVPLCADCHRKVHGWSKHGDARKQKRPEITAWRANSTAPAVIVSPPANC